MTVNRTSSIMASPVGDLADARGWWNTERDDAAIPELGASVTLICDDDYPLTDVDVTATAVGALVMNRDAATVMTWVTDPHGALDHESWMRTCERARDLTNQLRVARTDPPAMLDQLPADYWHPVNELVALAKSPNARALVNGPWSAIAALLAYELDPQSLTRLRPLTFGSTQVESMAWEYMRLTPILPIRTGIASAALAPIATALVAAAVAAGAPQSN